MTRKSLLTGLFIATTLAVLSLAGCGATLYTVTVTPSGSDNAFTGTGDLYIALAQGAFSFVSTTSSPTSGDVVAKQKITPGVSDALTFSVEGQQNYTAFAFFDVNANGAYDAGTDVSTGVTFSDLAYLEADTSVTLSYYY